MTEAQQMADARFKIIEGEFALVSAGNCTWSWMLDGTDIQERANAALGSYWSNDHSLPAKVEQRGTHLFAVQLDDQPHIMVAYPTREQAEYALSRMDDRYLPPRCA